MDDRVDGVGGEHGVQRGAVAQIGPDEGEVTPGDRAHPAQRLLLAVAQVVDHDQVVAGAQQFDAGVAADVTGTAGDQDAHGGSPWGQIGGQSGKCNRNADLLLAEEGLRIPAAAASGRGCDPN